uniref:Uncharacterized protein n=1 Tax=Strigamia maritima TaxID=126957 RepID=T1J2Z4_STRMM
RKETNSEVKRFICSIQKFYEPKPLLISYEFTSSVMNVFSNLDIPGMNNSLTMSPNFTLNTTSTYEDPVVLFISAITSAVALNYALTGFCVILFIPFVLPLIGITLFSTINYGIALVIYLVFRLKYRLKHGKSGIDADKAQQY